MSKFKIGQQIPISGIITVTGIQSNKAGNFIYNTDRTCTMPESLIESLEIEPVLNRHELHITCADGITTNAVYKLNGKVAKTAKAVCCPSDTYNFNTGAELAINRVLYGTDYNPKDVALAAPKQEDKPKFKVGDRVIGEYGTGTIICIADNGEYGVEFDVYAYGHNCEGVELVAGAPGTYGRCRWQSKGVIEPYTEPDNIKERREMQNKICAMGLCSASNNIKHKHDCPLRNRAGIDDCAKYVEMHPETLEIMEDYLVAEAEPVAEPIKLYCVKGLNEWLTVGHVYEIADSYITVDNGERYIGDTMIAAGFFATLVKRRAKVGEWVYILETDYWGDLQPGDVAQVITVSERGNAHMAKNKDAHPEGLCYLKREYLVLDGYQPEKVEPVYYSGKVVCVDIQNNSEYWTVGKVYEFINGSRKADNGNVSPLLGEKIKNFQQIQDKYRAKFIEYKGE